MVCGTRFYPFIDLAKDRSRNYTPKPCPLSGFVTCGQKIWHSLESLVGLVVSLRLSPKVVAAARVCLAAVLVLLVAVPGCVRRRMTIRSNPPGAGLRRRPGNRDDARFDRLYLLRDSQDPTRQKRLRNAYRQADLLPPLVRDHASGFLQRKPLPAGKTRRTLRRFPAAAATDCTR